MINFVRGILETKSSGEAVVDVEGVGYRVFIPLSTYEKLPEAGQEVKLHTHLVVRENAHELFGFLSRAEHEIFNLLISVPDVGPRTALNILSGIGPDELKSAIVRKDIAVLTGIPRVGRKTAEKITVELCDKISGITQETVPFESAGGVVGDAVEALVVLGYKRSAIRQAFSRMGSVDAETSVQALIKKVLKYL